MSDALLETIQTLQHWAERLEQEATELRQALAHGATTAEILDEYAGLTQKDIHACVLFATKSLENMALMPLAVETP